MNAPLILVDGSHVLKRDGTGISSYTRTLTAGLKAVGAEVALLLDRVATSGRGDLALAPAIQVFGHQGGQRAVSERLRMVLTTRFGLRREIVAREIALEGVDIASLEPPLPPFDRIFNANAFFAHAGAVFALNGRTTRVIPREKVAAAHWTAPLPVRVPGVPNLVTLHDLIPLQQPHLVLHRGARWARLHQAVVRDADLIVTVSERSREDIRSLLGVAADRVVNTYQPVPPLPRFERDNAERLVRNVYGAEPGKYAFFCGAIEPKKNLYRLIEAFLMAGTDLQLLIAGPLGWLYDEILEIITLCGAPFAQKPELTPVRRLGYLPRRHVVALMQCARFFAFPSIYEGFGVPAVEAMQLGTPVLASTGGSLPEVVGDAGVTVDPLDLDGMAAAVRRLGGDDDFCAELAARGPLQAAKFSREAYQERLVAAYKAVGVRLPAGGG